MIVTPSVTVLCDKCSCDTTHTGWMSKKDLIDKLTSTGWTVTDTETFCSHCSKRINKEVSLLATVKS